ncbi:DUF3025 domain-containing protein [Dokdonella soli]|uniref:DUF3025 domain-containing protein n=1 Tax=Dokdonella soli TaxID=529810 RepID=A0ABN1ICB7_9GAMM
MSARLRFQAPPRASASAEILARPPLSDWREYAALLQDGAWPDCAALEAWRRQAITRDGIARPVFAPQTVELLADGLHYEQRIADRGIVATREGNWHDLFNALVWLRHPHLKLALNARQVADIAEVGPKTRTRGQCAMTQFDEAGAIVWCADPELIALWDAHDWPGLFLRERALWRRRIAVTVFGHALLERQFLGGDALSTAKTIAVQVEAEEIASRCTGEDSTIAHWDQAEARIAMAIRDGELLTDPQQPRPLPLVGIPGWHADGALPAFYRDAPCFRPLRHGRSYPPPFVPGAPAH